MPCPSKAIPTASSWAMGRHALRMATTASTSSAIPATTEESAEPPSTQPSIDSATDGAANTAPSTLVTAPAASDPELAPPLNPPTGPRVAREVESMPVAGPATTPRINPAQGTTTDTTALGAPQTAAPGPLPPTRAATGCRPRTLRFHPAFAARRHAAAAAGQLPAGLFQDPPRPPYPLADARGSDRKPAEPRP